MTSTIKGGIALLLVATLTSGCATTRATHDTDPLAHETDAQRRERYRREDEAMRQESLAADQKQKAEALQERQRGLQLFEENQAKARKGDAQAQNDVGAEYFNGEVVERDQDKALHWLKKAAAQGNAEAESNLGVFYSGDNDALAKQWFKKAASKGEPTAIKKLHQMLALDIAHTYLATVRYPTHRDYIGGYLPGALGKALYKKDPIFIGLDANWALAPLAHRRDLALGVARLIKDYDIGIDAATFHVLAQDMSGVSQEIIYMEAPWQSIVFGDSLQTR